MIIKNSPAGPLAGVLSVRSVARLNQQSVPECFILRSRGGVLRVTPGFYFSCVQRECYLCLRLSFTFAFSATALSGCGLGWRSLFVFLFCRAWRLFWLPLRLLFYFRLIGLLFLHRLLWSRNLLLRLALRGVTYSLSLRLLCGFALGLLLSASRLCLITSHFSLLLLKLTRLSLSFFIASCSVGVQPIYFLSAYLFFLSSTLVGFLGYLAIIPGIPTISLELLVPGLVGHAFHTHRLRQILSKPRIPDFAAYVNRSVPEFLRNARRQIDLAATPCGMDYRVSKWGQCQRV